MATNESTSTTFARSSATTPCWHIVQLDLTGANGATNSVGANGGKGGLLPKVTRTYVDLFITDKP